MIAATETNFADGSTDRIVVVGRRHDVRPVFDELRARFPQWSVTGCDSYLSGIAELSRAPARVVVACVDESVRRLDAAVAALREAAGPDARLLLCCTTLTEPTARRVLSCGADDYLLFPFDARDLQTAVGLPGEDAGLTRRLTAAPQASMEELEWLAQTLSAIDGPPRVLLKKIAALVQLALRARGASLTVSGTVAESGEPVKRPVLSAAVLAGDKLLGRLTVGEGREGGYTPADAEKLEHYARLSGYLLEAASRQRQLHELARTDPCSGLPNRRCLFERLDEVLLRAAAEQFHVTLLLFDVDDFKTYNDRYGHDAGDEVLKIIGDLFRRHCREQDLVTRYGGDEFAVVFWDPQGPRVAGSRHPQAALAIVERFTQALRSCRLSFLKSGESARLTISGGLATFPWDASTREALITRADQALREAKRAGKNRVVVIGAP